MKIILKKLYHDLICVMSDVHDAAPIVIMVILFILGYFYLMLS